MHAPLGFRAEVHPCKRPVVLTPAARPGNFFSAAFENSCLAVAGASGGIFGMIGLYIADMILNFESIKRCVGDRECIYGARCPICRRRVLPACYPNVILHCWPGNINEGVCTTA